MFSIGMTCHANMNIRSSCATPPRQTPHGAAFRKRAKYPVVKKVGRNKCEYELPLVLGFRLEGLGFWVRV